MPPERIHFAHQVPLRDAADGRVTRHLRDQIDVQRIESGLQPHASGSHGGFASGMACAHHHHVEMFVVGHLKNVGERSLAPLGISSAGSRFAHAR